MARRTLQLSEVIARKGLGVAEDRMKEQVAKYLKLAEEAEAQAADHRARAVAVEDEFRTVVQNELERLGSGSGGAGGGKKK